MKDIHWTKLIRIANGDKVEGYTPGFIIDSPWLPGWYGVPILDYFTSDEIWLKANLKVMESFPEVIFLPGFWSEYGMCTEPSAFGAKSVFWKDEFPFAEKLIHSVDDIHKLKMPDPKTDGLLPFMLNRLVRSKDAIEEAGYKIRFSVSRGPMNIASFLMGTTELMTSIMLEPESIHKLMRTITDFLLAWHKLQRETFPSIDGVLILDDMIGFLGETEFLEFGYPYIKEIYDADVSVKFLHNDADCTSSIRHYPSMGVNLYNSGTHMNIAEMMEATDYKMTILGNIPPRDVLAKGSIDDVTVATMEMLDQCTCPERLMPSCGGGMPPSVSTENLRAFIDALK